MSGPTPLPPHLERFVHQQITAGRYHSADEVVRAALHLLEGVSLAGSPLGPRPEETACGWSRPHVPPARPERWETPGEWRAGSAPNGPTTPVPRRSPRGLLADLRSSLDFDDIREVRDELWAGLHPGGA